MHAVVERDRLFKSFRKAFGLLRTGNKWLVHAKPPCKEKTTQIAKQQMFILHALLFSQLRQLHMHIHRTNIIIVYCCYDDVNCKRRVLYLSSFGFNLIVIYVIFWYGDELKMIWTTPVPSHQLVRTSLLMIILVTLVM